jgi:non-ribosomal peptide synthetase-like protein
MLLRGRSLPELLRNECLPDILSATVRRRPNHPALVWGERTVTYAELGAAGEAVAEALRRCGAARGRVVGLFMPRGADLLIAQAGICMSGAAWLPFDEETPPERVRTCMKLADACGLVTWGDGRKRLAGAPVPMFTLEELLAQRDASPVQRPHDAPRPADPAYVIYTSGSTGEPKGIVTSHRSICHFLRSENEVLGVREDDRVYQGFSVAFDMSFEEIWISYLVGATLWIAPGCVAQDPESLAQSLTRERITVLHTVPTLMGLMDDPLPTVRLLNLGGEACPESLVGRLARPGRRMFNTYGPTEAGVSASVAELEPGRPVTIGKPLPNCGLMVVDDQQRPLPLGETGELCIFGPGLAIGYLGRPDLTAERFVTNPLAVGPEETRLYRTGDLARIDAEGEAHWLGRADGQVKVRGFRVELGEIETALAAQPGVAAAAVTLRWLPEIDMEQLLAFVVPAAGHAVELASLRKALAARLPAYMVPARFEIVSQLPRLISGKVDRKALRDLPLSASEPKEDTEKVPRSADEEALYAALEELFPAVAIEPNADFFDDLGGHSLLAARLVSGLRADPAYETLSVGDVYRERRLSAIAEAMRQKRVRKQASAVRPRAVVSYGRRILCGVAQAAAVPGLILLHISGWLLPFFVYHYFTGDEGDSIPLAALYSLAAFVLAQVAMFGIAVAGKWLAAGRVRPGRFPLWGAAYFRWWLADRLAELPPVSLLTGTPWLVWYLRALGARVGRDVMIDSLTVRAPDLLTIEEGASVGMAVHVDNARVEGGLLIIGSVRLGRDSVADSYVVLENDTSLGAGARLSGLSALAAGRRIPDGEIWEGSPARRTDRATEQLPPRPVVGRGLRMAQGLFFAAAGLAVGVLFFVPLFPSFMLIDWMDVHMWNVSESDTHPLTAFVAYFLLAIPASLLLVLATALLAAGLRRLSLRRQKAGLWPVHSLAYCRKWLITQVLDNSLSTLHGLYASVFAPAWLRLMGAKVGRGTEVSTATGIVPDLLELGEHSFIADGALLGDEELRGGWMVLRPTAIGDRSFVGNGAYVSDGAAVPADVLIGVQTRTPENRLLKSGQTWLGSPPLLLPARERLTGFDESLTFRPSRLRWLARAAIEALRIVLPLAFLIATGYMVVQIVMPIAEEGNWPATAGALALAGCLFGLVSFALVVALKWILVGRYRPRAAPMWTLFVWLSEAVTNLYESLAVPNLLDLLRGTPLLPWALRLLGAQMGRGVYMDTTDLTEFDCVGIGDEAELNAGCGPQTHLFEDRIMKIGRVAVGRQVTVGSWSTILYNTQVGDRAQLGPLTLVAKGERLPAATRWEGSPAEPVHGE